MLEELLLEVTEESSLLFFNSVEALSSACLSASFLDANRASFSFLHTISNILIMIIMKSFEFV